MIPDRPRLRREDCYPAAPVTRPEQQSQASEAELEAIVRSGTEQLLARVGAVFAAGASRGAAWVDQLRAVGYELRDFLREDEARARAMMIEAPHGNAATRRIREDGIEALAALIDLGRAEADDPGSIPRTAAEIAAGVVYNRIHVGVEAGVGTLSDEMVRELMYTAVMPYLGIEAALAELGAARPARPS